MNKSHLKQRRNFTVDGDINDWLIEKLSGAGVSLSSLVDGYLGYLHYELKEILDYCDREKIDIDRSWLISASIERIKDMPPNWDVINKLSEEVRKDFEKDVELGLKWEVERLIEEYEEEKKEILKSFKRRKKIKRFKVG